jgi:hypothetical protein
VGAIERPIEHRKSARPTVAPAKIEGHEKCQISSDSPTENGDPGDAGRSRVGGLNALVFVISF